jgi:hypothetical protein
VKAGDVSAVGGFKTTTINALRSVIDEKGEGFFPPASNVSRSRRLLDKYGEEVVGFTPRNTPYGEVFFINFEAAFRLSLKACGLYELAQRTSVKVALAVDGGDLFNNRSHVTTGLKITDERALHPITKQPFLNPERETEDDDMFLKVQTSEVCSVMIIADAKDNKHLYEDVFKEYYDWGEMIRTQGIEESNLGPKLMPFSVAHTTDLKATWFLTSKGGGCKTKTFFAIYALAQRTLLLVIVLMSFGVIDANVMVEQNAFIMKFMTELVCGHYCSHLRSNLGSIMTNMERLTKLFLPRQKFMLITCRWIGTVT